MDTWTKGKSYLIAEIGWSQLNACGLILLWKGLERGILCEMIKKKLEKIKFRQKLKI